MPVLVALAEHSRTHHAAKVADKARRALPQAEVTVLPGATHHSLPVAEPEKLNDHLIRFLG
ncbi:alpha/beta fold hydrolase [Streptomyces albogriseolus]|uniref:alpha/beta fold hydrolase n=1 Tax=Streptomyces albogriseolus TaxID=1887 RepID=UPI0036F9294F